MIVETSTRFHLVNGRSPYIAITEFMETAALLGEPDEYILKPGQAFWGISFEELARAKHGMLIMSASGVGLVVANDDWADPEEPR